MKTFAFRTVTTTVLALVLTTAANATGYNLRGPGPEVGDTIRTEAVTKMTDGTMEVKAGMISLAGKTEMTIRNTIEVTVLEMKEGKVTKVRTRFIDEKQTQMVDMMGQRNETATEGALQGRTIVGTYADDLWTFELENGTPTAEQRQRLQEIARDYRFLDKASVMYPDRKVEIGESWDVNAADLHSNFARTSRAHGKVTYTLDKVEQVDGEQLAHLTVVMDYSAKAPGEGDGTLTMKGKGTLVRSLKSYLDVSSDMTGTMELHFAQGDDADIRMSGPMTFTSSEKRP